MEASGNGRVEAVRLLLASGADVNAKGSVSTCECTDVSVSLFCVSSVCVLCCWYVCYYRQLQYVLVVVLSLPLYDTCYGGVG